MTDSHLTLASDLLDVDAPSRRAPGAGLGWLGSRKLQRYPGNGARAWYLCVVVLATVVLYYELYVGGSVSTQIMATYHMSFNYFVWVSVAGNAVGAVTSLAAGVVDRWGRTNLVVCGLGVTGVLVLFALPHAPNKATFLALSVLVGVVEGFVLVATPALVRDFSPQIGRASAMGFWTLGPVLGSLIVTEVSSSTLPTHPDWRFQYEVCGVVGVIVFVVALFGLRELDPRLRDQIMVSLRDRALVEARAAGIDPEAMERSHWKDMRRLDIIGPALAISLFLLFYYIAVGFFVVYFTTVYGYDAARANGIANWYWIGNALALVITGVISDVLKVRKPLMVVGALISALGIAVFATKALQPDTGYYTLAGLLLLISIGAGIAYCAWMAAYTETVEKHNPAATATGLAVWGWTIRAAVTIALIALPMVVTTASPLVDHGNEVAAINAAYPEQVATLQQVDPATLLALKANPGDPQAQIRAISELVSNEGVTPQQVEQVVMAQQQYPAQIATLQKLDPTTSAALQANPGDPQAQDQAVAEIAGNGITAADVARVQQLSTQYAVQLATLQRLSPATQAALLKDPANVQTQDQAVAEIAGNGITAADVAQVQQLSQQYAGQLAVLQRIDPATQAALAKNPQDASAQAEAVAEVGGNGLTQSDVLQVMQLSTQYAQQLATIKAIDPQTLAQLNGPNALSAAPKALSEVENAFGIGPIDAYNRLAAIQQIPKADLALLQTKGPAVQAAGAELTAAQIPAPALAELTTKGPVIQAAGAALLATKQIPPADLALISADGPAIQAAGAALLATRQIPAADLAALAGHGAHVAEAAQKLQDLQKMPADLANYLAQYGPEVAAAKAETPHQWASWWWLCFAAQLLFLPFVPLMTGRWSPAAAHRDAREHARAVEAELEALHYPTDHRAGARGGSADALTEVLPFVGAGPGETEATVPFAMAGARNEAPPQEMDAAHDPTLLLSPEDIAAQRQPGPVPVIHDPQAQYPGGPAAAEAEPTAVLPLPDPGAAPQPSDPGAAEEQPQWHPYVGGPVSGDRGQPGMHQGGQPFGPYPPQ